MPAPSSITFKHTATDDLKFSLVHMDVWLSGANIHVMTNSALYGTHDEQIGTITTADVVYFKDFNMRGLFFRNLVAGSNTTIYVIGIPMTEARKKELGVE